VLFRQVIFLNKLAAHLSMVRKVRHSAQDKTDYEFCARTVVILA